MNIGQIAKIIFILLIILILIAVNIGLVRWSIWFQLFKLWPIFIAAFVLEFAFEYFNNNFLKIIPVVLCAASILAVVYLSGMPDFFSIKKIETKEIGQLLGDNSIKNFDINVRLINGKLNITGGEEDLYSGTITYREKVTPFIGAGQSGNEYAVVLKDNDHSQYLFGPADGEHSWNMKINNNPFINLETKTSYSTNNFDFTDAKLLNAKMNSEYDTSNIKIGDKSDRVHATVVANFSGINFLLPAKAGIRIRISTKASLSNIGNLGFNESSNVYSSSNYLMADKKIDIDVSALASSINFDLY